MCGDREYVRCEESLDPAVTMLAREQEDWLLGGLSRSSARWNVIAQQVMMGNSGEPRIYWHDAWDGYPLARQSIIDSSSTGTGGGYVRCRIDRERWLADLRMVPTVRDRAAPVATFASFVVEDGRPGAVPV